MKPEHLRGLRECCRSEAAFEQMRQILLAVEAERQQIDLSNLCVSLFGEQVSESEIAAEPNNYHASLRDLIVERTTSLQNTNQRLRQEISDRKWAEQALQESEKRFRALIENATDLIAILDEKGMFRYCSPSTERVLGHPIQEVVGHSAMEFVHPEDYPLIRQVLQTAIQYPRLSQPTLEYRVRHRNGSWCFFEAVATSLLEDPAIKGVVINCHDITERKRAEDALLTANRRIVNILESITDAFVSFDLDWRFTYLNHQAAQLFRQLPANLLGQNIWQVFPEAVGSRFDQEFHRALESQAAFTFEEFFAPVNTWFEVRGFPSVGGLSVFFLDVTERRQAQAELLEMSTALGNAVEGIARLDLNGHYIALNRAYAAALGYQQEDMIGMSWQQTVHPDDLQRLTDVREQMLVEGKAYVEARGLRKDGSTFHKDIVMVAAYDWHDQLTGHHCFTKDITERKRAEETLRQQAERERLMVAIAQRIRNSLNLEEILNTTVLEVRQFLKADRAVIYHIEANGDGLVTAESVETGWTSMLGFQLTTNWFKLRQNDYRQGKNSVIDDVQQTHPPISHPFLEKARIKALLVVPILTGNQLWGILAVHQCSEVRHWEPFEISLLEQLATQVAIAIQQSGLYQQVQQLNAELEGQVLERTAQLQQALQFEAMLKRITDAVRDSLDEAQILQTAVQELVLGLEVDGCDAALYNLEQQTSTICYEYISSDFFPAKGSTLRMSAFQEIYDHLLQGQHFQFCLTTTKLARASVGSYTILACPMIGDQGGLGDLWLFKSHDQIFTSSEIRLVQQVANQCAIAIRQARLFQAAQAQVVALEEINRLKDDFLSTVSHELRTPMANMKMAIHMLRNAATDDRRSLYLDILQSECGREIELINDLLDLQRLETESDPLSSQPLNLQEFSQTVIEPFRTRTGDRQQQLTIHLPEDLPNLMTNRAALERVLAELINNACKYTPPGGEIALTVHTQQSVSGNPSIIFAIRNQAEIPAPELPRIFEKFYRVPNADPWKQGGTGLGLALVQRLVLQLGGTIQVDSKHQWTTFTVSLPLINHP